MRFEKQSPRDTIAAPAALTRGRDDEIFDSFDGGAWSAGDGPWSGPAAEAAAIIAGGRASRDDFDDRPVRMRTTFMADEQMSRAVARRSPGDFREYPWRQLCEPAEGPWTRHDGPDRQSPDADGGWLHRIAGALSRAMAQFVEGFALSAAAVHPGFVALQHEHHAADPRRGQAIGPRDEPVGMARGTATFHPLPQLHQSQFSVHARSKPDTVTGFEISRGDFPAWGAWTASLPGKLWAGLLREREFRRMRAELEALDDRSLKDIGLCRYDIDLAVRHGRHWE